MNLLQIECQTSSSLHFGATKCVTHQSTYGKVPLCNFLVIVTDAFWMLKMITRIHSDSVIGLHGYQLLNVPLFCD